MSRILLLRRAIGRSIRPPCRAPSTSASSFCPTSPFLASCTAYRPFSTESDIIASVSPFTSQIDDLIPEERVGAPAVFVHSVVDGPSTRFGTGTIATLTESSVVGTAGKTVVLSTVATERNDGDDTNDASLASALQSHCHALTSFAPLTVTYQERHHSVGRIPSNSRRRDNLRSTNEEVLASRAIDRALRPLLVRNHNVNALHVNASVQAHDVWGECGNPVALALNSASVALTKAKLLQGPVACVYLCYMADGTIIMDPSPAEVNESLAELLYAGTRTHVVMMECSSPTEYIPEDTLVNLIKVAHAALEPILDIQAGLIDAVEEEEHNEVEDEEAHRLALGLPPLDDNKEDSEHTSSTNDFEKDASQLFDEAYEYCQSKLKECSLRLFGFSDIEGRSSSQEEDVSIHPLDQPLLSKAVRGQREHLVYTEIERLLKSAFTPQDERLKADYEDLVAEENESISVMARAIHNRLLKAALVETATQHQTRGDIRGTASSNACRVVRPISVSVPALPDSVHGSAMFARGDTQVLCTATLGAPVDGIVKDNPFQETKDPRTAGSEGRPDEPKGPYDDLPVGSLRYLKSQEALLSDMNSRKVKAEKEVTGESGTLDEVSLPLECSV